MDRFVGLKAMNSNLQSSDEFDGGLAFGDRRMLEITRRRFVAGGAMALAATCMPNRLRASMAGGKMKSKFQIAVITDEISQDFEHACSVAAVDFGMKWVELRALWGKSVLSLKSDQIAEAQRILKKYDLRVTDIGSPLFKVDWPYAPLPKSRANRDLHSADFTFKQQDEVLEKSIELAKTFKTNRIRGFDFWRLDDQGPYREGINTKLAEAAEKIGKHGMTFILENEMACNTGTGAEAAKVLAAIPSRHLMLNWDPGNAAALGETPFPNGWNLLPKDRIGHCHVKDTVMKAGGGYEWAPVGKGVINWVDQFKALKQIGYHLGVSLETHWHGGKSAEDSTRQSWAGMKAALETAETVKSR
jgi:sugar phosphate isomerase/epimerase